MLWGNSDGRLIAGADLGSVECFELLLEAEASDPDVFHVIYSGNYDVNMMLRDVPVDVLERLKRGQAAGWGHYRLHYLKGKWFRITRGTVTVTLYDVFTFFGTSFVKALEEYIGEDDPDVVRIREGKQKRDSFTLDDLNYVRPYWEAELRYLCRLCNRLRDYLATAGIHISRWHGPGAVASTVLRRHGARRAEVPAEVNTAAQYAYSGGRFEAYKIGLYDKVVYQYDIRSAYPYFIAQLPNLHTGTWIHRRDCRRDGIRAFAVYRVSMDVGTDPFAASIGPLPWRARNGSVYYPTSAHGGTWVWGSELLAAMSTIYADLINVHEGWEYEDDGSRPYSWINEMYTQRAEWKACGEPAQLALKLAMNSIYGKLAQQVGASFDAKTLTWRLPTYHQLEYAGFITASARGMILTAMYQCPASIIATETDAVFSTTPLRLPIGSGLGQWEATTYSAICYLQSGLYIAEGVDKNGEPEWKTRSRGVARTRVDPAQVLQWVANLSCDITDIDPEDDSWKLKVSDRRFRTLGTHLGKPDWRRWVTDTRKLAIGIPGGKREHFAPSCTACASGIRTYGAGAHDTVPALSRQAHNSFRLDYSIPSHPYSLLWKGGTRDANPFRDEDVTYDEVYG